MQRRSLFKLAGGVTVTTAGWPASSALALAIPGGAPASGTDGTAVYASSYGVTGINDGTRDDTPLLQTAYAAAVAGAAKALILPQGDVYFKSYTADSSPPYSYVIR